MLKKGDSRAPARGIQPHRGRLDRDTVAAQGLGFLAAEPERLQRFMSLTGLDPAGLRQAATQPGFTLAVLTHLCEDEPLLLAFAQEAGLDPEAIGALVRAHAAQQAWDGCS